MSCTTSNTWRSTIGRSESVRSSESCNSSQQFAALSHHLCIPNISCPQEEWGTQANLELTIPQPVCPTSPFQNEGAHLLKGMLQQGDWLTKIDLKKAYYALPIHFGSQYLLSFMWNEKLFHFTCLPFGLSCAPQVFTKMLKPVVALLRGTGVRLIAYIDDILMMSSSKAMSHHHTFLALDCLESLGFLYRFHMGT